MSEVVYEVAGLGDAAAVQLALYTAISWNGDPKVPPLAVAMQHPDVALYHEGWGRSGDIAVKALVAGQLVGAAFARLFTEADHGYGYLDEDTPELGIGVVVAHRRKGIGRRLMDHLAELAKSNGVVRLSLSVNNLNPAKDLYLSLGYQPVSDSGESSTMVLEL